MLNRPEMKYVGNGLGEEEHTMIALFAHPLQSEHSRLARQVNFKKRFRYKYKKLNWKKFGKSLS